MRTKLSSFNFDIKPENIAKYPAPNRDESRLMVIHRKSGLIEHRIFKDILTYFKDGDAMIFNNTKVFAARMFGKKEKTGSLIEVFLLRELNHDMRLWDVLVDPARKIRVGNKIYFEDEDGRDVLVAEVVYDTTSRGRTIRFLFDGYNDDFKTRLGILGQTPLPKYIERDAEESDKERYQTVYAKEVGAVAAPTAGLHFSRELLKRLELKGVNFAELTLHVGLGTFRSIEVEDLSKHKMDAEYYRIPESAAEVVNKAKEGGHNVCAVGTTVIRTVESSITSNGLLKASEGWTNKFIYPPYDFQVPNRMITNFHLPKSSLIILVSAFAGQELTLEAYNVAIKENYRFYSYGDAMMII